MTAQIIGFLVIIATWTSSRIRLLLSNHRNKEASIYASLMGIAAIVGSLLLAEIEIPSVIIPFNFAFKPLGKMILGH